MRFNINDDRSYFILGASIAAGRSFWLKNNESNKYYKNNNSGSVRISADKNVITLYRGG